MDDYKMTTLAEFIIFCYNSLIMRLFKHTLTASLLLAPLSAIAGSFNIATEVQTCPVGTNVAGVNCYSHGGDVAPYITGLIGSGRAMFGSILFAMLIFYGIKLLLGSRDDNTLSEVKSAYGHAFAGAIVVGAAFVFADTFATAGATDETNLTRSALFNPVTAQVIFVFKSLIATVVSVNLFIQGARLIMAQEDGDIDKAKKGFLRGMIGAAFAILANALIRAFTGTQTGVVGLTGPTGSLAFINEAVGIGQYIATIMGALSVIGVIVAGIMLVVSVDESLKDRAKKLITISLVSVAVSAAAYGIVELFLP